MVDDSVSAVVARLIEVLEESGVTYAFGGAIEERSGVTVDRHLLPFAGVGMPSRSGANHVIALAAWSEPRATADVDVILWIGPDEIDSAIELVRRAGVDVDATAARAGAEHRGMFAGRAGATRVDVFVPSIPFYSEAEGRRVRTTIGERATWVHSAEVLAVFKMLFFRPKDLLDVERMLAVRGASFDRAFVRAALVDMLEEDERITKWDALCARVPLSA